MAARHSLVRPSVRATRAAALAGALFAAFLLVSGPASASVGASEPAPTAAAIGPCALGDVLCYLTCILGVAFADINALVGPLLGYVLAIVGALLAIDVAGALAAIAVLVTHAIGWAGSQLMYVTDIVNCLS